MAHKVIMPKQGLQMTEGTIMKWLISEGGDAVEGKPLFEMETDKLTIEMDSPATGKLLKIIQPEGAVVPITEIIAVIGEPGEDISEFLSGVGETAAAPAEQAAATSAAPAQSDAAPMARQKGRFSTPRARTKASDAGVDIADVPASGPGGLVIEADVAAYLESGAKGIKATPLARKIAQAENIPLEGVTGSGVMGKIRKGDLASGATQAGSEGGGGTVIPMRGMRKIIAENMSMSLRNHAQLTHTVRADMKNASDLRETYKAEGVKISYNDIVLKAVTRALMDFPVMNSTSTEDSIIMKEKVNLGIAVALEAGLIVPNIKDDARLSLAEFGQAARELSTKARENGLSTDDYAGGTFTVSNLGMYGLHDFTAIINPPESGILAVGAIEKTPVVLSGDEIAIRPLMSLTLTYDHRVVDGAPAAEFLVRVKKYIEHPCLML